MPRTARLDIPDLLHHVIVRGKKVGKGDRFIYCRAADEAAFLAFEGERTYTRVNLVKGQVMVRNRSDIIDFLSTHKEELAQRFGVTSIGLFGSFARADAREASDIDIAVELSPEFKSLRNFFGLRRYLEQELGRPVDLGIESALKPQIRDEIAREIIHV